MTHSETNDSDVNLNNENESDTTNSVDTVEEPTSDLENDEITEDDEATKDDNAEIEEERAEYIEKLNNIDDDILDVMEELGGHTLERHVGKSDEYLINRLETISSKIATTFTDKEIATKAVKDMLSTNAENVSQWIYYSTYARNVFNMAHDLEVGKGILKETLKVVEGIKGSRIVLDKTDKIDLKFRIITCYPNPTEEECMRSSNISYFCECYLIMLDYDEELEDIVKEFIENETDDKIAELRSECKDILDLNEMMRGGEIKEILSNSIALDIESDDMIQIIEFLYKNL